MLVEHNSLQFYSFSTHWLCSYSITNKKSHSALPVLKARKIRIQANWTKTVRRCQVNSSFCFFCRSIRYCLCLLCELIQKLFLHNFFSVSLHRYALKCDVCEFYRAYSMKLSIILRFVSTNSQHLERWITLSTSVLLLLLQIKSQLNKQHWIAWASDWNGNGAAIVWFGYHVTNCQ